LFFTTPALSGDHERRAHCGVEIVVELVDPAPTAGVTGSDLRHAAATLTAVIEVIMADISDAPAKVISTA
jgi:hypothetical protein